LPIRKRPLPADAAAALDLPDDQLPIRPLQPLEPSNGASRDDHDATVSTAELGDLGLPMRVRQASLAPQLRDAGSATTPPAPSRDDALASPEAARSTMSALQRGWQLGRAEADSKADQQQAIRGVVYRGQDGEESAAAEPDDADQHKLD
jgi:hypothetical protein